MKVLEIWKLYYGKNELYTEIFQCKELLELSGRAFEGFPKEVISKLK